MFDVDSSELTVFVDSKSREIVGVDTDLNESEAEKLDDDDDDVTL